MASISLKPKIIIENGRPISVVLDIKDYKRLINLAGELDQRLEKALADVRAGRVHGPFSNAGQAIRFLRRPR